MATKKAATKKTAAKKSPTKRTAAKKTATKKTAAKRSASRRTTTSTTADEPTRKSASSRSSDSRRRSGGDAPRAAAAKKKTGARIAAEAAGQLLELTGRDVEGITGFRRTDDGWAVEVEVLEVRRIPDTTDVLALYEVTVDEDGEMEGYRRLRRYTRGQPGEG